MKRGLYILALFFSVYCAAQDSHLGLSMGTSLPLGNFAASNDYLNSGYAKTGFTLAFDANYIPTWYFGVGGSLNFATSAVNEEKALEHYLEFLQDIDLPVDLPEDVEVAFGYGNWNYVNFLVGPTLAIPGDILQFNVKALFGASVIIPPSGNIEIYNQDRYFTTYNDQQSVSFAYQLGSDLIYKMRGNYSLKLGADYFGAKAKYDVLTDIENNEIVTSEKNVDINSVHVTLGLAYLF